MPERSEALCSILTQTERMEKEVAKARCDRMRRSSFEGLCARYCILAKKAGESLNCSFPVREVRGTDFGLSVGIVRPAALEELAGLISDIKSAMQVRCNADDALRCPKAAGRACQMRDEIDPRRFEVFFAIPFRDPPTCKEACDVLIDWLERERGFDGSRIFRADQWTYSGDFVCKICKAIQESRVVVADITGGNPNVFFELGLAVGLGKPTILIHDEKAAESRIPSDLLAWEYIPYDGGRPTARAWQDHFGVVFDGSRQCGGGSK